MKIPIIRKLVEVSNEDLDATVRTMETLSEARGLTIEELDIIGEVITNALGAIEVKAMIADGMRETEALNIFAKKVTGAIDRP